MQSCLVCLCLLVALATCQGTSFRGTYVQDLLRIERDELAILRDMALVLQDHERALASQRRQQACILLFLLCMLALVCVLLADDDAKARDGDPGLQIMDDEAVPVGKPTAPLKTLTL